MDGFSIVTLKNALGVSAVFQNDDKDIVGVSVSS